MSVPNQTPYIVYNANGLTTVFSFEFYIISAGDIQVSINGEVVTSGFTVAGVGNVGGGDVIFNVPPESGSVVMLERVVPTYRLTDYQDNGDLLADTVNKDFDRLWMAIQRSFLFLNRTLRAPEYSGIGEIPSVDARKNKMLAFDDSGQPIAVLPPSDSAADVLIELAKPTGAGLSGYRSYTVKDRLDEDISVGAISGVDPTGNNDSSAAFQNFFNLLQSGRVTIPSGNYRIDTGLVISNNSLTISGKRSYLDGVSAVKLFAGSANTIILTMTGYGSLIEGILFQGYENNPSDTVNGWGQGTTCVGIKYLRANGSIDIDSIVRDCSFNYFRSAIDAYGSNLQVTGNLFASNRISVRASALPGLQFRSIVIHRNRFHHCGGGDIANTDPTLAGTCCINLVVDSTSISSSYAGAMQITNNIADAGCHTFFIGSLHRGSILSNNTLFRMSNGDVIKVNNISTFSEKSYDNFLISNNVMANDISRVFNEDQGSGYFITLNGVAGGMVANNTATNMRKGGIYCSSVTDVCFFNTQLKDINVWKSVDGAIYDAIAFDSACQNNIISKLVVRCAQADPQFRYVVSNNGTNLNVFGLRSNAHTAYLFEGASASTGGVIDARQRQRKEVYATATSTLTGNFLVGDICWFTSPITAGYIGAVCSGAGSAPSVATWRNFGAIA